MSGKVVIVEDEPNIVESLTFVLENAGNEVVSVADGESAIRLLETTPVDAIVLDVMLPRLTGFEVLKWIRAHERERLAQVPVLILTAKGQDHDRTTAKSLGVNEFISKPFSNQDVVDCVERLTSGGT